VPRHGATGFRKGRPWKAPLCSEKQADEAVAPSLLPSSVL
jgi:hypothetical protein